MAAQDIAAAANSDEELRWHDEIFLPTETFEEDRKALAELFMTQDPLSSIRYQSIAFSFASCLSTSEDDDDLKLAARLFQELADDGYRQRDCYYRAAVCYAIYGAFSASRRAIERCASLDPKFEKARQFQAFLATKTKSEGRLGFIVASALAAVFMLLIGFRRQQLRHQMQKPQQP